MEILGVLLGITFSGLVIESVFSSYMRREMLKVISDLLKITRSQTERIEALEKRKPQPAETGSAVDAGNHVRKGIRMRAWNENVGAAEETK